MDLSTLNQAACHAPFILIHVTLPRMPSTLSPHFTVKSKISSWVSVIITICITSFRPNLLHCLFYISFIFFSFKYLIQPKDIKSFQVTNTDFLLGRSISSCGCHEFTLPAENYVYGCTCLWRSPKKTGGGWMSNFSVPVRSSEKLWGMEKQHCKCLRYSNGGGWSWNFTALDRCTLVWTSLIWGKLNQQI